MEYFYAWGQLFVLPFTIFFYIKANKAERLKMVLYGLAFGILSVLLSYWSLIDYYQPKYIFPFFHFEDFTYGFCFAGILPSVHTVLSKKSKTTTEKFSLKNFNLLVVFANILIVVLGLILGIVFFKLNTIYVFIIIPMVIGLMSYIIADGRGMQDVLITVGVALFITVIVYNIIITIYPDVISIHFLLENVSSIKLLRVPIEEWLFAASLAFGCTYNYEAALKH